MSVKKMNLVTIIIFVHLLMFMVRGNLDLSPDEEADGKKQWEKYCGARNDVEFSKRVTCSEMDGKIYYFEPEPNMFVGSTNLREICRSKFSYNPGADMVSIDSCDEYKRFTGIVDGFVKKNEFNKPIKVYTSGYFSPSLAEGGKSGVYRWMKSNKQATEFFENAPKCMDWDEGEPTTPDYPLKLLTIEAKESNIRSKFIPWKYPQFSPTDGYLMCELSVPGNKVVPPPQPEPEKPDQPKPPEDPGSQPEIKPGGKTEEEDNPADIPDDEQESREEIGKFFQGLKDELSKVNAPVIEVTQQLADKLSTPNFSINDQTHLNQVIELTGELDEKIEEKMPSAEDPLIWRYNFTKKICKVYADVLQPRNEKAWRPLKQEKRLKDCQSIISRTENLGIKLACEMKDPGNLLIDVNDIGLETFSYDPDTMALKAFIFPSNITRSKRITNSHILFPKGLNISGIPKACRNQKPVALGTIHKKLIEKMNTNNALTPIASEMIAFSFGSEITDIQVDVNLVHNQRKIRGDVPICAFWDTNSLTWNTTGCWVDNYNSSLSHTVCRCNHLTNFAVLMDISGRQTNSSAKDILSTVGLSLSVLCLIVTNFLLLFVPSLKSRRTTITINISICMLVGNLVTLFGLESTENETSCRLISALLLYSLAALFSWMFLEGYFLYQMIIVVFRGSGYLDTKWLYLIGYGLPTVWTFSAVLILGFEGLYHPNSYYCWIANPFYPERMWVFAGPVIFILFFNMAIFAKSFHVAFISNMNKGSVNRKAGDGSQKNSIIRWFKGWLSLFVLLGLTWLIGFFQFESSSELASYIFIIMNSFQGVFIFLFEIVTNSKARPAVIKALSGKLSSEYLRSSKTTNSTNPYSTSNSRTGRSVISNDKKNGIFTNSSRIKMNNSDSYELK